MSVAWIRIAVQNRVASDKGGFPDLASALLCDLRTVSFENGTKIRPRNDVEARVTSDVDQIAESL